MTSRQVLTLILVLFSLRGGIALAQGGSDTDPRFEKLAKDLYPKAKQEGALVVGTSSISNRSWTFSASVFPASTQAIGRERVPRSSRVHLPSFKAIKKPRTSSSAKALRWSCAPPA